MVAGELGSNLGVETGKNVVYLINSFNVTMGQQKFVTSARQSNLSVLHLKP